ncbi:energy-coupling factor ABC transporter ATP-binding protein [Enterococcus faecalis]|uniref:energy-coupling factor ABC transporter ATP-binding protein n=1 Tax=Enterococcus faecalis TaxID=1351 RepID=UPI0003546B97|nr:ABC transporter ATP-binding protein [Enterococcus faecalis]EPI21657.1 ABC transporter, ATP-binding protein [Enterococcus faecalis]EPI34727.1 ABC transporter, ATP-binding protein [Enterococcus faecalis WKS-26-18-2]UYY20571.1 energy-coupling factor ABC transporter ATP-binding protein [Enterococcus faecalis]UYY23141.1 energy-coupling factor ABC transporter ATP-binding protein [Enterococcus faecalis]
MSYLELREVGYIYPNGYEAIKNVRLSFELGESVAIIGQNGAGKTTTVKLMNGLLRPTTGKVLLENEETEQLTTAQLSQSIGYVFQNPDDQIFQETIYKEIAFGLKHQGLSKKEINKVVETTAELCGLKEVLFEHPYNLPYAKRKFITIAAIIAMNPKVLIFDKPTAGQDRESIERLSKILNLLKEENKCVITITHDMEFVASEFQRVIVFSEQEKQKEGSPRDIFWDAPLLKKSALKQPYICQLAKGMGYNGILTIEELLEADENETIMD